MSIIHKIVCKRPLDISMLDKFVSTIDGATYENRGEDVLYFWIKEKSNRGFDITFEDGYIEVRNTILSNRHDYDLTNKIVTEILSLTDGIILDEDEEPLSKLPIFDNDRITETEIRDCELIHVLSREKEEITIYGPIRKIYFGKRMYEQLKNYKGKELKNKMFDVILTVNYQIPDFGYGNIMQVGNSDDDKKIMKLLTNEVDYIIDKYDYILLQTTEEQPIMITNEILNSILPSNWTLVDEFTVVAPITNQSEWHKLLGNAKKHDLFESFMKN
jgi:hypothetical protein